MVIYFLLDFGLNIYISENKFLSIVSLDALIEYLTTLPVLGTYIGIIPRTPIVDFFRALRFIQVSKMDKLLARHAMESTRTLFRLLFNLIANLLINSAALYLFESTPLPKTSKRFV